VRAIVARTSRWREASYAALRCPLRHQTAKDGGNAENAGAFFGLPPQSNARVLRTRPFSHPPPPPYKKGPEIRHERKGPARGPFLYGGGGGNRTRVRKSYVPGSTCIARRLISSCGNTTCEAHRRTSRLRV